MARGAVADLDNVLALGLQGKVFIEGRDAVDLCFTHLQFLRKDGKDLARQVVVDLLDLLQDGNDVHLLVAMLFQDLAHSAEIMFYSHVFVSFFIHFVEGAHPSKDAHLPN